MKDKDATPFLGLEKDQGHEVKNSDKDSHV